MLYDQCVLSLFERVSSTYTISRLPLHLETVVDDQVRPMLMHLDLQASVYSAAPHNDGVKSLTSGFLKYMKTVHSEIDVVMTLIQNLDHVGRTLEASLVALHCGGSLISKAKWIDPTLSADVWISDLVNDDYLSRRALLARMRLIRTLHHIEYRACLAYMSATEAYGFDFVASRFYCAQTQYRWTLSKGNLDFYGLPNHELAELCHMRALTYAHKANFTHSVLHVVQQDFIDEKEGEDFLFPAVKHAYIAWRLDKRNVKYAALFQKIVREHEEQVPKLLSMATTDCAREDDTTAILKYIDHDGQERVCRGTIDVSCGCPPYDGEDADEEDDDYFIMDPTYLWRAREVAKRADVAYDRRREVELSELEYQEEDEVEILTELLDDFKSGMKFNQWGIEQDDVDAFNKKEVEANVWKNWSM